MEQDTTHAKPTTFYRGMRTLFRWCLLGFYNTISVVHADRVPANGIPTILCPNHSNSLTDSAVLMTQLPRMVRFTAKDTLWKQKNIFSYFIKRSGAIPIMRRKDHGGADVDNTSAFASIVTSLANGDCVCLFPEGVSRYHSDIAPLRTGVAQLVAMVLKSQLENKDFQLHIVVCGLTYLHREKFRSNVLLVFDEPIVVTPADYPAKISDEHEIQKHFTALLEQRLRMLVLNAPTWEVLHVANMAHSLYCEKGPGELSLDGYVRLTQQFVQAFKGCVTTPVTASASRVELYQKLLKYREQLHQVGVKDYRIHQKLSVFQIVRRLIIRILWSGALLCGAAPGLLLTSPIFLLSKYQERRLLKKGVENNKDEISMYKMASAVVGVPLVVLLVCLWKHHYWKIFIWLVPLLMWLSIRMLEDGLSAARAAISLFRLLTLSESRKVALQATRTELVASLSELASEENISTSWNIPPVNRQGSYFSLKRRRQKDWNEVLRLGSVDDYTVELEKEQHAKSS